MLPFADCQQLEPVGVYAQIVHVESGFNPFAIGVVNGRLERQPKTLDEATATAASLQSLGYNFSIGLAQINKQHFRRFNWDADVSKGFDVCQNLQASRFIFDGCLREAQRAGYRDGAATKAALSCYYSGDFERGTRLGYSDRVLSVALVSAAKKQAPNALVIRVIPSDQGPGKRSSAKKAQEPPQYVVTIF